MGSVMKPLAGSPFFTDLMGKVAQIPVLGILFGAGMTWWIRAARPPLPCYKTLHPRQDRTV